MYFIEEKGKEEDEVKEEEFGDLDRLLRIERLKEQERKDEGDTLESEVDEAQVSVPYHSNVGERIAFSKFLAGRYRP